MSFDHVARSIENAHNRRVKSWKSSLTDSVQAAAAQQAAAQQNAASMQQQKEVQAQQGERAAKQQNLQALQNDYQGLLQQERELLVAIGRIKNAQEAAHRKWISTNINDPAKRSHTDPAEANLPLLEGQLDNVREEKKRVRDELARAQRGRIQQGLPRSNHRSTSGDSRNFSRHYCSRLVCLNCFGFRCSGCVLL